jgi:DNA mismatch endonuclease (patch repair protein)
MDVVTPAVRSRMMAGIKGMNTQPEIAVRRALHKAGFRFRLHRGDLPGKPDLIFPRYRTVVFVHGCFWHSHPRCRFASIPATNAEWWREKFRKNRLRDRKQQRALATLGWRVLVIWECEISDPRKLQDVEKRLRQRS